MRTLVMADRETADGRESEPVFIDTDAPGVVRLELGEGELLELDEAELRAALERKAA